MQLFKKDLEEEIKDFYGEDAVVDENNSVKKVNKRDYYSHLTMVQVFICAALVLGVFLVGKASPGTFQVLKKQFNNIVSENMSAQEVIAEVKKATDYIFVPPATQDTETDEMLLNGDATGGDDAENNELAVAASSTNVAEFNFKAPVKGRVSSKYGYRTNPITGNYSFHTGLDIAADEGTKIGAASDGTVVKVGEDSRSGKYVMIEHQDGIRTLYCHCSKTIAEIGDEVMQGDTIALVGSTGWSTGPHLHIEIKVNDSTYDPAKLLNIKDGYVV